MTKEAARDSMGFLINPKKITYKGHTIIPVHFEESNKTVFDLYMGITYRRFIGTWNSVEECKEYVDRPTQM